VRTEEEIVARLAETMEDERLSQPPATIQINAPLALIQLGLETRRDTLRWVLGLID
jgi:hypothetical protein